MNTQAEARSKLESDTLKIPAFNHHGLETEDTFPEISPDSLTESELEQRANSANEQSQ